MPPVRPWLGGTVCRVSASATVMDLAIYSAAKHSSSPPPLEKREIQSESEWSHGNTISSYTPLPPGSGSSVVRVWLEIRSSWDQILAGVWNFLQDVSRFSCLFPDTVSIDRLKPMASSITLNNLIPHCHTNLTQCLPQKNFKTGW